MTANSFFYGTYDPYFSLQISDDSKLTLEVIDFRQSFSQNVLLEKIHEQFHRENWIICVYVLLLELTFVHSTRVPNLNI